LIGGQRIPAARIRLICRVTQRVLKDKGDRILSVAFVDKKTCKFLNEAYYGGDGVTDVLSFPANDDESRGDSLGVVDERYLGEILIYYPRAKSQAEERGVVVRREVELLLVHGLLHLYGYDHMNDTDRSLMFGVQDLIIEKIGK